MPLLIAVALLLLVAPGAQAAWFQLDAVDGPSPDIVRFGSVDVGRDGTGALAYVKRDAGVPHVFVSRQYLGTWQAPERVDNGLDLEVSEAAVASADSYRVGVTWIAGHRLYGAVYPEGTLPGSLQGPALLYEDPQGRPLSALAMDMGINGTAFATFTVGGDVKAVRLMFGTWEIVPGSLDIDPAREAGTGAGRSKVVVAADGNPIVVWGEGGRVWMRRIYGITPSAFPQELSVPDLGGAAGGDADSPDVDVEWDGSFAWAVWRQDIGGASRTLARRLVGSTFDPGAAIDGGQSSGSPHVAVNGRGAGYVTTAIGDTVAGAQLEFDKLRPAERIDLVGGRAGEPLVAVSDTDNVDTGVVWLRAGGELRGRYRPWDMPWEGDAVLSRPEFGPIGEYAVSSDRAGDIAVAGLAGEVDGRRIVAGGYDVAPGKPATGRDRGFQKSQTPRLTWTAGLDLWGQQTFRVLVDGQERARGVTGFEYVVDPPLEDGMHTWQVVAVDARGQEKLGTLRKIGVDVTSPRVVVKVTGKRRAGRRLRVRARGFDGQGSGIRRVVMHWGDGTPPVAARSAVHRYRRGKFRLRVTATDRVGNRGSSTVRLRIRR
jgi:hypothetical protein